METIIEVLIGSVCILFIVIIGLLIWLVKQVKRTKAVCELANQGFGWIDTVVDKNVKMNPDLKKTGKKLSHKFHKLDLVDEKDKVIKTWK